jgi:hypothetical protein
VVDAKAGDEGDDHRDQDELVLAIGGDTAHDHEVVQRGGWSALLFSRAPWWYEYAET